MGQYYRGIILAKESNKIESALCDPWEKDNRRKLMKHSYIDNYYVILMERFIYKNPQRIVWAGDYADEEKGNEYNLYGIVEEMEEQNAINIISDSDETIDVSEKYVINHTKQIYYKRPSFKHGMRTINPLTLLISEGNGLGGGDYYGTEMEYVGSWARDLIEISDEEPNGYTCATYNFKYDDIEYK